MGPLAQRGEPGIECDLPQVTVRILEVTRVTTIKRWLRRFDDLRTRALRLAHDSVDLLLRGHVVTDGEFRGTWRLPRKAAIRRQTLAWPKRELKAGLKIEESDRTVLELGTDDALCAEAKTVAVEGNGAFEIVDSEGE